MGLYPTRNAGLHLILDMSSCNTLEWRHVFDVHSQKVHEDMQERLRVEAKVKTALAEVGVSSLDGLSRLLSTLSPEPLHQTPPIDSGTLEASEQNADLRLEAPKQNNATSNSMLEAPKQNNTTSKSMLEAPKQNSTTSDSMLEALQQYTDDSTAAAMLEASEQKGGHSATAAVVFSSSDPRTGAVGIAGSDVSQWWFNVFVNRCVHAAHYYI